MSVWMGFAQAQGVGKKVLLIRDLVYGTDIGGPADGSWPGSPDTSAGSLGVIVTIRELTKIDYAVVQTKSGASSFSQSGYGQILPNVIDYSANTFCLQLLTSISGNAGGAESFGSADLSGVNVSGVVPLRALIIGEAKRMVRE